MKVLLANPPWLRPGWYGVRAGSRWPHMERAESPYMPFPFLLGYAAAVLEADGVEVEVLDACAERMDRAEFLARFEAAQPDVFMAEISTPSFAEDMETFQGIRDLGFEGPILAAGIHKPMFDPAFFSRNNLVDGVLVGEYELTMRELLRQNLDPKTPIPGLIWNTPDGPLDGGRKPSQEGLDAFPWPARHLFPMDRYHDLPGGIPSPSVQLWGSRGCSFTCSFCAWPQILYGDHAYRTRSADAVADEVLAMQAQGYASVYFDDDTFNLGKRRTADIAKAFQERGVNMPWAFMGRADTCDPRQYEDLVKSGLQAVKYGVESADTARLKQIGKNLDVERVRESISIVKSLGIKVHLTFMFGLPGETLDTMQRTLDLAYELDPDSAQFTVATPFPGSRLHEELTAAGRLDGIDLSDLDGYRSGVVSTDALEAEQIVAFVHGVHRRWETRSRPAGVAPKIPLGEIGGSGVSVALLARQGDEAWLVAALQSVLDQEGPSRELVVVAEEDPALAEAAAAVCDWATWIDVPIGTSTAAMANEVSERCVGRWIAFFQPGARPGPGWLEAVVRAGKANPDAGALSLAFDDGSSSALTLGPSGRIRRQNGVAGLHAVSSRAGAFSRALLEDSGGFDPSLPGELADADLALRGLLLGYRNADTGALVLTDDVVLLQRESSSDAAASRAWGHGRLRFALKSVPRETWEDAGPALVAELSRDLLSAVVRNRHPVAMARGVADGVREARVLLAERRKVLGRRRVGPAYVRAAFDSTSSD
jgi:anaerobic magnesium-protoporphyrin IX monomethyl ester cyclase